MLELNEELNTNQYFNPNPNPISIPKTESTYCITESDAGLVWHSGYIFQLWNWIKTWIGIWLIGCWMMDLHTEATTNPPPNPNPNPRVNPKVESKSNSKSRFHSTIEIHNLNPESHSKSNLNSDSITRLESRCKSRIQNLNKTSRSKPQSKPNSIFRSRCHRSNTQCKSKSQPESESLMEYMGPNQNLHPEPSS